VCTAHCSQLDGSCPADKPAGADAVPRCALENRSTGEKYCALMCAAGMSCGQGASCKIVQGNLGAFSLPWCARARGLTPGARARTHARTAVGICTWDDVADKHSTLRGIDQAV